MSEESLKRKINYLGHFFLSENENTIRWPLNSMSYEDLLEYLLTLLDHDLVLDHGVK